MLGQLQLTVSLCDVCHEEKRGDGERENREREIERERERAGVRESIRNGTADGDAFQYESLSFNQ